MENKLYNTNIQPANRLSLVNEYYFSTKGKEVARMNAEGKDIIRRNAQAIKYCYGSGKRPASDNIR